MTMDPILSIKLLRASTGAAEGQGVAARFVRWSEYLMETLDERYQRALG
jgi:hypothetical protein